MFSPFSVSGFEVKVVTSDNYVRCDSGLIYLDIDVGKGDCPKDGQQVFSCIFFVKKCYFLGIRRFRIRFSIFFFSNMNAADVQHSHSGSCEESLVIRIR